MQALIASSPPGDRSTMQQLLSQTVAASSLTDAVVLAGDGQGVWAQAGKGSISAEEVMLVGSSSEWISSTVVLRLVQEGALSLADTPNKYISAWRDVRPANLPTLAQLLAGTHGLASNGDCQNESKDRLELCVIEIRSKGFAHAPGRHFVHSASGLATAAQMAMGATGKSWGKLFEDYKAAVGDGLSGSCAYELMTDANPQLQQGLAMSANDYALVLRGLLSGRLLNQTTTGRQWSVPPPPSSVVASTGSVSGWDASPAFAHLGQPWRFGLGVWLQCDSPATCQTLDGGGSGIVSSTGEYGFYAWIDPQRGHFGLIGRYTMAPLSMELAYIVQVLGAAFLALGAGVLGLRVWRECKDPADKNLEDAVAAIPKKQSNMRERPLKLSYYDTESGNHGLVTPTGAAGTDSAFSTNDTTFAATISSLRNSENQKLPKGGEKLAGKSRLDSVDEFGILPAKEMEEEAFVLLPGTPPVHSPATARKPASNMPMSARAVSNRLPVTPSDIQPAARQPPGPLLPKPRKLVLPPTTPSQFMSELPPLRDRLEEAGQDGKKKKGKKKKKRSTKKKSGPEMV